MDQSDGSRRTVEGNALDAVRSLLAPHAADPWPASRRSREVPQGIWRMTGARSRAAASAAL